MINKIRREVKRIPHTDTLPYADFEGFMSQTVDGIHLKKEATYKAIMKTLDRIRVEIDETQEEGLQIKEWVTGTICYRCGHADFRKRHDCSNNEECWRCLGSNHHPAACISRALMCSECGRRGHAAQVCRHNKRA